VVLKSYAKLNLYLAVLNKRKDDYHNIKTLFERVDLHDSIQLTKRADGLIKIRCADPAVPPGTNNLCYKSARLLQEKFGITSGVEIKITKRIPVGAGLGGGSSNAACTLLGLNKLWKLGLSRDKLERLAQLIGADVPFFIFNAPFAFAFGRGDKIKPLPRLNNARLFHILAVPSVEVSTPLIYKRWDKLCAHQSAKKPWLTKPFANVNILTSVISKNKLFGRPELLYNGLEAVTAGLYPEVKRIRERLAGLGVLATLMSGSGPAVFGIVSARKEALSLAALLKKQGRSMRVFVTTTW